MLSQLMNLSGRTALITGATGHLGRIFTETILEMGGEVILTDVDHEKLAELKDTYEDSSKIVYHASNLEDENQRNDLIRFVKTNSNQLSILINNAAFAGDANLTGWSTEFESQSLETFRRAIEVNLTANFHLVRDLHSHMVKNESSTIINVGSIYGLFGPNWTLYEGTSMGNPAAYGISKAGLHQFTRWLATTLAPNIRVNAIAPGGIYRNQDEKFVAKYVERTPLKRMAKEEDFVGVVAYLSSDMSKYVTGQIIEIDGGWGAW